MPPKMHSGMVSQPSRFAAAPVVKWLMIINIAVYFLDMIVLKYKMQAWGPFSVATAIENFQIWRFITFQFLHDTASFHHLLVNMLGLFFFGHFAERWWGSQKFLIYYLSTGAAGALLYVVLFYAGWFGTQPVPIGLNEMLPASYIPLVGASAGIFGILACVAIIAPNLKVLLFFILPMSMRTFAYMALGISAVVILFNLQNAGGEAGHLGGAILGFVLMKFPFLLNFIGENNGRNRRVVDARVMRDSKMKPRIAINLDDSEIDRILDKVNRDGLQSLTEEERDVLKRVANQ